MNLRMDLDILDARTGLGARTGFDCSRSELDLERPKEAYQSPLQRIGEALRVQQQTSAKVKSDVQSITPQEESQPPSESKLNSPSRPVTNFSYKLLPGDSASTPGINTNIDAALGSVRDPIGTGSIIGPAQEHAPQNRGYFPGTSLLSFLATHELAHPSSRKSRTEAQAAGSLNSMQRLLWEAAA